MKSMPIWLSSVQVGVGGQLGVEDQFLGQLAGALLPELDESQDLVVLLVLAELGVGVAEDAAVGVLGEEGQDALLTATALGDVVFLDQGVLAVKGNGVEVEIEGDAPLEPQLADGIEPALHELRDSSGIDAAAVLGQEGALGDHVEPGEQSASPSSNTRAHDMAVARVAEQLQRQQGAHGVPGRHHLRSREARPVEQRIEPRRGQPGQEQEQPAEAGAKGARGEVELAHIGTAAASGRGAGAAPRRGGAAAGRSPLPAG